MAKVTEKNLKPLVEQGMKKKEIAKTLKVSVATVAKYIKKFELDKPKEKWTLNLPKEEFCVKLRSDCNVDIEFEDLMNKTQKELLEIYDESNVIPSQKAEPPKKEKPKPTNNLLENWDSMGEKKPLTMAQTRQYENV